MIVDMLFRCYALAKDGAIAGKWRGKPSKKPGCLSAGLALRRTLMMKN
jgi:hypothetical protein